MTKQIQRRGAEAQRPRIKIRPGMIKAQHLLIRYIQEQDAKLETCHPHDREGHIHKKLGAIAFFEKMMGCSVEQALKDIQEFKKANQAPQLGCGEKGGRTSP